MGQRRWSLTSQRGAALQALADRHIVVQRAYVGTFLTALEMGGCSISIMRLNERRLSILTATSLLRRGLDFRCRIVRLAWIRCGFDAGVTEAASARAATPTRVSTDTGRALSTAIRRAAQALLGAESHLTELDRVVGDSRTASSLTFAPLLFSLAESANRSWFFFLISHLISKELFEPTN